MPLISSSEICNKIEEEGLEDPSINIVEMEGLLPLVFKSIKKNNFRRQYNHLSTEKAGSAPPPGGGGAESYNISDFYEDGYNYHYPANSNTKTLATAPHQQQKLEKSNTFNGSAARRGGGGGRHQHRRHNSHIGEYYYHHNHNSSSPPMIKEEEDDAARNNNIGSKPKLQQLVRFRSHRFLPSCVTGAAS